MGVPSRSTPVTWPGLRPGWLVAPLAPAYDRWPPRSVSWPSGAKPSRIAPSRCSSQSGPGVTPPLWGSGRTHSQPGPAYASRASPCAGKSRPHASRSGMPATSPRVTPARSDASRASPVPLWETCLAGRVSLPAMPFASNSRTSLALIPFAIRVTSPPCPHGEWDKPGKWPH